MVGDDLYLHGGDAAPNHVQTGCRFAGYVENPAFFDGAAIIDAHQKVTSVGEVGYPDDSPERQETMGSREGLLVVAFAVGGFSAVKLVAVERGFPGINLEQMTGERHSAWGAARNRTNTGIASRSRARLSMEILGVCWNVPS